MIDFPGYITDLTIDVPEGQEHVYPYNVPAVKNFKELSFHPHVTYLIGENGMGKSTLLEAIAIYLGFNAEGGSRNFHFSTRKSHADLHQSIRITKGYKQLRDGFFLRSESFYNVATEIDNIGDDIHKSYGGISLHEQSHGEAFWALFMNRFNGNALYILDEPEAALSVHRQMAMLTQISRLAQRNSQFIIATHSPIILAYPDSIIYELGEDGINSISYEETDLYRTYKGFLNNTQSVVDILIK
jgi:predicted ATPase